jgi:acyl-CoA synthetase (AMP-forming)/AMP-acid ligase II
MNIASLFGKAAQRFAEQTALRDLNTGETLSFAVLPDAFGRVANQLAANGIHHGDRVALLGGSNVDYLICDYAIMAAGRVRVPLDPSLSMAEQVAQLIDSNARMLICEPDQWARGVELAKQINGLAIMESRTARSGEQDGQPPRSSFGHNLNEEDLASLSYTGGTTGMPKAVMITHGSLCAALQNIVLARNMSPGDTMLNVRPAWPIAAIVVLAHLAAGGTVLMTDQFEPARFLEQLQTHHVAATSLVPTHLARLMDEAERYRFEFPALRVMEIGAAAIPSDLFRRVLARFGPRVGIIYGLTEAPWSCYMPPAAFDCAPEEQVKRMCQVGRPLFGVEIAIRLPDGSLASAGEAGEVTLRGRHITPGYWQRPELTAAVIRDGWFHTGDLGVIDQDGYLAITGRIKELIRSGGKSVVPAEVEAAMRSHSAVMDVAVLGLPDKEWGEIVVAAVVVHPESRSETDEQQLIDWCRERLSGFKKPRRVYLMDEIPRSHYGKVLRSSLLNRIAQCS